jgi:hypothetical protein
MASVAKIQTTVLGLTAAVVLSLALGENDIVPSRMYSNPKPVFESKYSWENEHRYFGSEYKEVFDKYEAIHAFASKMFENSQDLEPSIVEFVSKNFWNLI